eukprot:1165051-Rhodomonas_salina.1
MPASQASVPGKQRANGRKRRRGPRRGRGREMFNNLKSGLSASAKRRSCSLKMVDWSEPKQESNYNGAGADRGQ